ncbi:hypothetical protein [Nocardia sp. NPDC024068]|uniref:hypothetical protein n=1 Tax=Nocardia sp. NPDC024068 TaxID=3157197 RepID=UPI0033EC2699
MANQQRWARERWPELTPERDEAAPGRAGRRGDGEYEGFDDRFDDLPPHETRPVVNPYAIVALVAALLLLFPVAIVFGLIAFGHPRGRLMAFAALVLGLAEIALLAALILMPRDDIPDVLSRIGTAVGDAAGTSAAPDPAAETTTVAAPTPSAVSSIAPPTSRPAAESGAAAPAAERGTPCPEPALVGTGSDGGTLLCLTDAASVTGYEWAGPFRVADRVGVEGARCGAEASTTARTSDGHALVCENGNWALWVS